MKIRIHWGVAIAIFYTAFALSTVGFVAFAMTRDVELVSDDYYAQALAHDRRMQATANADGLGQAVSARVEGGQVRLQLPREMASRVRGTATLYRASDARADRAEALVPGADGAQVMATAGLPSGHWRIKLQWSADGRDYYVERDIRLP
ncbi:hypothetical protein TBR22_A36480 [Luteitalea sp. TBR-22]|uniref:FixH family protein n=1 Tax=Luteitalea sp. TBR-22 TaxID=2802971 RepID=UPI001AF5800E|nr:FixH family protein [Luteitalea sp. TBR-22]BCS34421.1 hypothetical protein TBR22_A36480 [Luteitalea sp. TBR-22]